MVANNGQRSDDWLEDYFRRMISNGGNNSAIVDAVNRITEAAFRCTSGQEPIRENKKEIAIDIRLVKAQDRRTQEHSYDPSESMLSMVSLKPRRLLLPY